MTSDFDLRAFYDDADGDTVADGEVIDTPPYWVLGPPADGLVQAEGEKPADFKRRKLGSSTCWRGAVWGGHGWRLTCDRVGWWSLEVAYRAGDGELAARTWSKARFILCSQFGFTRNDFHLRVASERCRQTTLAWDGQSWEVSCCVWQPVIHKPIPWCTDFSESKVYADLKGLQHVVFPDKFVGTQAEPWPPRQEWKGLLGDGLIR